MKLLKYNCCLGKTIIVTFNHNCTMIRRSFLLIQSAIVAVTATGHGAVPFPINHLCHLLGEGQMSEVKVSLKQSISELTSSLIEGVKCGILRLASAVCITPAHAFL